MLTPSLVNNGASGGQHAIESEEFFLLPVWPFLPMAHSGDCSLKLPRTREQLGPASGVEQHRDHRRRQRKGARRTLQTFGSTCDLISLGQAGHPSCEIYANTLLS